MAVIVVKGVLPRRYIIRSIRLATPECFICNKTVELDLDYEKVMRWANGEHIQKVWPEMSADERERLISGTCPECWNKL